MDMTEIEEDCCLKGDVDLFHLFDFFKCFLPLVGGQLIMLATQLNLRGLVEKRGQQLMIISQRSEFSCLVKCLLRPVKLTGVQVTLTELEQNIERGDLTTWRL